MDVRAEIAIPPAHIRDAPRVQELSVGSKRQDEGFAPSTVHCVRPRAAIGYSSESQLTAAYFADAPPRVACCLSRQKEDRAGPLTRGRERDVMCVYLVVSTGVIPMPAHDLEHERRVARVTAGEIVFGTPSV